MKIALLLVGLLCASVFAQDIAEAPSPGATGKCGTNEIQADAKCACYRASLKDDIPDMLLNACRQSFGDNLADLAKFCRRYSNNSFDDAVKSKVSGCQATYDKSLKELSASAQGPTPVATSADVSVAARPIHGWPWPYPFYWCWGWGWWWWWWILRFYICWIRYGPWWWRYCRIYPWFW